MSTATCKCEEHQCDQSRHVWCVVLQLFNCLFSIHNVQIQNVRFTQVVGVMDVGGRWLVLWVCLRRWRVGWDKG